MPNREPHYALYSCSVIMRVVNQSYFSFKCHGLLSRDVIRIFCVVKGQDSNVTEEILRAQEEAWKCAEETDVPKEEPEDREDELAQIKAEIKKLLKEVGDICYMKYLVFRECL